MSVARTAKSSERKEGSRKEGYVKYIRTKARVLLIPQPTTAELPRRERKPASQMSESAVLKRVQQSAWLAASEKVGNSCLSPGMI